MLTNLQSVFACDVQKLLSPAIEIVDLMGEVVDLGLVINTHKSFENTGDGSQESSVSGEGGYGIGEDVRQEVLGDRRRVHELDACKIGFELL